MSASAGERRKENRFQVTNKAPPHISLSPHVFCYSAQVSFFSPGLQKFASSGRLLRADCCYEQTVARFHSCFLLENGKLEVTLDVHRPAWTEQASDQVQLLVCFITSWQQKNSNGDVLDFMNYGLKRQRDTTHCQQTLFEFQRIYSL